MTIITDVIEWIAQVLDDVGHRFYDLFLTTSDWIWPFNLVSDIFWHLTRYFMILSISFLDFNDWVLAISEAIANVATLENIQNFFSDIFDAAVNAWNWVLNAWDNVTSIINQWWASVWPTIAALIDSVSSTLAALQAAWDEFRNITFPQWTSILDTLRAAWDEFWTQTFPNLVSFSWLTTWWNSRLEDINDLINSKIADLAGLIEVWENLKDQIIEFFSDPLEWLWSRFADWFLGPEG